MEQYTNLELEDMRSQLATLKEKLHSQEIINNKLLRKAVAKKMTGIRRHRNRVLIMGTFAVVFTSAYFIMTGFSPYFVGYTEIMILFSLFMTYRYHSQVEMGNGMNGDLLNTAKELKSLKRSYNRSYFYSIPMVMVFIGWFFHEATNIYEGEIAQSMIVGASVGAVLGFILGVSLNRKLVKMCDDIISDIEGE